MSDIDDNSVAVTSLRHWDAIRDRLLLKERSFRS